MSRLTSVRARVLELDPRVADVLLAAALTAGIAAEGALQRIQPQNSRAATLAVTLVLGVLLVWRRTAPPIVAPLAVSWLLALSLLHGETKYGGDFAFAAAIVAVYSLGSFSEGRRTYWALGACTVVILAAMAVQDTGAIEYLWAVVLLGGPFLAGRAMRSRRLLLVALRERASNLEDDRAERERRAVEEERARIARELHDVVTHSVSVMTVQASAVRRIAHRDPERGRVALEAVETTGRAALTDMRRLLGVLRHEDDDHGLTPQPGMRSVDVLLGRFRARGLDVDLTVQGEPPALTPGLDLAAYRVLEDALDSARRHEAVHVSVELRWSDRELEIRVRDDGLDDLPSGAPDDHEDVVGMRERVALYGGILQAGRRPDGRYGVRARIPIEAVAA